MGAKAHESIKGTRQADARLPKNRSGESRCPKNGLLTTKRSAMSSLLSQAAQWPHSRQSNALCAQGRAQVQVRPPSIWVATPVARYPQVSFSNLGQATQSGCRLPQEIPVRDQVLDRMVQFPDGQDKCASAPHPFTDSEVIGQDVKNATPSHATSSRHS